MLCVVILSVSLSAQKGYYNALLDYVGTEVPFEADVSEVSYSADGIQVVEYYSKTSDRFLGLKIDNESIDAAKLKIVKENRELRNLIAKIGFKEAMTFLYDNISPGMTKEEVYSLLGKPERFKYGIDQSSQILSCYYIDSVYDSLIFRDNVLEKINYL